MICLILMFDPYRVVSLDFRIFSNHVTPSGGNSLIWLKKWEKCFKF